MKPGSIVCLSSRLVVFSLVVVAQVNQAWPMNATELYDLKDGELTIAAATVQENFNLCDSLRDCGITRCSRPSCYKYGVLDQTSKYECLSVLNNTNCGPTCTWKNFDFSQTVLRRPVNDVIGARTVCAQKTLEDKFKTMTNLTHFFRVFFGSSDGTMIIFPGADEDSCDSNLYDPRLRPWYSSSTAVQKVVIFLVDVGSSMQAPFQRNGGVLNETYISKAKNIPLKFLDTLQKGDFVKVILFNAGDVDVPPILNNAFVNETEISGLKQSISAPDFGVIHGQSKDPTATNATNVINAAISQLNGSTPIFKGYDPAEYLKVVIVLTRSPNITQLPPTSIQTSGGVVLFAYKFDDTMSLEVQPIQCVEGIKASFERIPFEQSINNPLYAMRSFYRFLAKLHIQLMGKGYTSDYSPQYKDYSEVEDDTFTLSRSVFFGVNDSQLLGVVGIDFFPKKVEKAYNITPELLRRAANPPNAPTLSTKQDPDNYPSLCVSHMDPCQSVVSTLTSTSGMCNATEQHSLKELNCCNECRTLDKKWSRRKIAGVAVGCLLGVALLIAGLIAAFFFLKHIRETRIANNQQFIFPGTDDHPPVTVQNPSAGPLNQQENLKDEH